MTAAGAAWSLLCELVDSLPAMAWAAAGVFLWAAIVVAYLVGGVLLGGLVWLVWRAPGWRRNGGPGLGYLFGRRGWWS